MMIVDHDGEDSDEAVLLVDTKGLGTSDLNRAVAKRVLDREGIHHYIKFSTMGFDRGHMLNPYGMYFKQHELSAAESKIGKRKYEYRLVPSEAFQEYVEFLKTRNEAYLRNAERRILDA